jgi:hypothetical protein
MWAPHETGVRVAAEISKTLDREDLSMRGARQPPLDSRGHEVRISDGSPLIGSWSSSTGSECASK